MLSLTKCSHKQVDPRVEADWARRASQPLTQSRRLELSCRWISLHCSTLVLWVVVFLACCDVSRLTGTVSRFLGYHEELLEVCGPSVGFSVVLPDHKSDERIVQKDDVIRPLGSPCRKQWLSVPHVCLNEASGTIFILAAYNFFLTTFKKKKKKFQLFFLISYWFSIAAASH